MKKPSLLATGLAFASSLFVAAVALSTVTPKQTPDTVSQSPPAKAQKAVAGADPLASTIVIRLVRSTAG
jgi:hypothetical protein